MEYIALQTVKAFNQIAWYENWGVPQQPNSNIDTCTCNNILFKLVLYDANYSQYINANNEYL